MISLNKSNIIGKGNHREVYVHPENPDLCIKIIVDGDENLRQEKREVAYLKHLEKKGISWEMLSRYYGDVETNLGTGSVYDLILDYDGSVSKTLGYYIDSEEITTAHYDGLSKAIPALREYLLENRVITTTLAHRNVVYQIDKSGDSRLFVIDNIGNQEITPICTYVAYLGRRKIARKWLRFLNRFYKTHAHNKVFLKMLTDIKVELQK